MTRIFPILLAAVLLVPAAARADTVADDPDAQQVTALGGTIVWVSGRSPQKLMQRNPDGTVAQVAGTTEAAAYRDPDLGRDARNGLVLTYARCSTPGTCIYVRDDLAGNAVRFKGLAPKGCALSSTPAVWRSSVAYGLSCVKRVDGRRVADDARSGLHLRKGTRKPVRFAAPGNARRSGALGITDVDLRSSRIAAIYADIYAFAVVQSTTGSARKSVRVATTEGDGDQHAAGVVIGTGDVRMWTLTRSFHAETPAQAIIQRIARTCAGYQTLTAPEGPDQGSDYPLTDLAVDNGTLYAVDPGVGIVTHAYAATAGC